MDPRSSSYYPPRASGRLLSPGLSLTLDRTAIRLKRELQRLPSVPSALELTWRQWLLALAVPGYAYAVLGKRLLAWWMAATWLVAGLVLLIFLGHTLVCGWALGALASSHASGLGFLLLRDRELRPDAPPITISQRIGLPLATWFICAAFIYWPAYDLFQRFVAKPLLVEGQLIIINPRADAGEIRRGDLVAYRYDGGGQDGVRIGAGLGVGPVLGLPGDQVEFTPEALRVNGHATPRAAEMPGSGELTVAPATWFLWPRFKVVRMNLPWDRVLDFYLRESTVAQTDFVGRPFKRWFFRRQDALN